MSFGRLSKGYVNSGEFGDYQNIRFPEIPKANSLNLLRFNPRKLAYKQNSNNSLISGQGPFIEGGAGTPQIWGQRGVSVTYSFVYGSCKSIALLRWPLKFG
ncbi:Proteasome subunit beta type-3 [Fusarium oxysporum f. sp. albedinis]|nr:Proteasome subunit beta type-3 [Fusarium oxysporum f. sp. albedinis]